MTAGDSNLPRVVARPYRDDSDFWRVRNLLIETYPITPTAFNWSTRRWDSQRFHRAEAALDPRWAEGIRLWETEGGRLVGVVSSENHSDFDAVLQVHPDYRHIEEEMLAWAEAHLAVPSQDGSKRRLLVSALDYDTPRRRLLERRGYEKTSQGVVSRRLRFGQRAIPQSRLAAGYTLRTTRPGDMGDCLGVAELLNAAFELSLDSLEEIRTFWAHSPSFRHDLDLVAEAPDGSLAAHVGVAYDPVTRCGIVEPVGTHPSHWRRGLALALLREGLRRLCVFAQRTARRWGRVTRTWTRATAWRPTSCMMPPAFRKPTGAAFGASGSRRATCLRFPRWAQR